MNPRPTRAGARLRRYAAISSIALAMLLIVAIQPARATNVTINSSGAVTFLDSGTSNGDFAAAFTAANFTAAQTGTSAFVQSSTPFYFTASSIPGASWIGTNAAAAAVVGDTALYAISFSLPSGVSTASFSMQYGVDNDLGDTNAGIYINGTALPNSTGIPCGPGGACGGAFASPNTYTDPNDIASLLQPGTNWLYIDEVNLTGPGALIFSATINYSTGTVSATPEPSSFILLAGTGLLAALAFVMRKAV